MAAVLAAALIALSISSCGSSTSSSASGPISSNLLTASELSHYPANSVQRAFLNYWSALQFQSWADVASYYDPRFREFVGTARVISAKKQNGSTFPMLKPEIVGIASHDGRTTLHYTLRLADGSTEQASTTWDKVNGNWQIIYDSRLDSELNQLAVNRTELQRTGALPTEASKVSPTAARAGSAAAQLQARFLQEELNHGR